MKALSRCIARKSRWRGWPSYGDHNIFRKPAVHSAAQLLVGGSGKTTVTDGNGSVADRWVSMVDGADLCHIDLAAWRHQIGYVPRETPLFHDTVRRNVTLGGGRER